MKKSIPFMMMITLTAACGGGSGGENEVNNDPNPPVEGTDIRSGIVVESNGSRYVLSEEEPGSIAGEQAYRINVAAAPGRGGFGDALVYTGGNVTVAAGTDTGNQPNFAAVSGSSANAPGADATFTGHYSIADSLENLDAADEHGALTLTFDLSESTLTGTSDNGALEVDGTTTSSGNIGGSVTVDGSSADLDGGFFGAGAAEVAAGFSNDDFGGYIYGQQ